MASRTNSPANPTLQGTTDDASRGGLFARSAVANPVSGADVNGTPINNATVTFSAGDNITLNGAAADVAINLNQANDATVTIASTATGGGGGPSVTPNNATITLAGSGGIQGGGQFTVNQAADSTINFSVDPSTLPVPDLQAITFTGASTGTYDGSTALTVNIPTGEAATIQVNNATVTDADFTNSDSILFDTTLNTGVITAEARPQWTGNTNRNGVTGNVNISRLILDASTGLILQAVDATNGVYTLTMQGAEPPAPTPSGSTTRTTVPPAGSALDLPTPPSVAVTSTNGMITSIVSRITGTPDGTSTMVSVTGTPMIAGDMMSGTVTYPASTTGGGTTDYSEPGTYTVTTETTTDNDGTEPVTRTETETFTRFIPFFQIRGASPTTAAQITAGTASTAAYDNTVGFTSIGGSGSFFFATAALTSTTINTATFGALNLAANVRYVRSVQVPDAGGVNLAYQVYQVAGVVGGQTYTNFRTI